MEHIKHALYLSDFSSFDFSLPAHSSLPRAQPAFIWLSFSTQLDRGHPSSRSVWYHNHRGHWHGLFGFGPSKFLWRNRIELPCCIGRLHVASRSCQIYLLRHKSGWHAMTKVWSFKRWWIDPGYGLLSEDTCHPSVVLRNRKAWHHRRPLSRISSSSSFWSFWGACSPWNNQDV